MIFVGLMGRLDSPKSETWITKFASCVIGVLQGRYYLMVQTLLTSCSHLPSGQPAFRLIPNVVVGSHLSQIGTLGGPF